VFRFCDIAIPGKELTNIVARRLCIDEERKAQTAAASRPVFTPLPSPAVGVEYAMHIFPKRGRMKRPPRF